MSYSSLLYFCSKEQKSTDGYIQPSNELLSDELTAKSRSTVVT